MIKNVIFISVILTCSVLAQLSLQSGADWFQYALSEITAGQWWRLITGNLIHLNWQHFAMNASALIVMLILLPDSLKLGELFSVFLLCSLGVTLALWAFHPSIYWYVGLSGALHGVLVVLLLLDIVAHKNSWSVILCMLLMAKLAWEGLMGPLPGSEATAGGPVVVQAHFYGALSGVIMFLLMQYKKISNNK